MTESTIFYSSSENKVVQYCVRANIWPVYCKPSSLMREISYEFTVAIILTDDSPCGSYLYKPPIHLEVYKTSFYLERDFFWKAFKNTVVSFCELLFPENKEKERELKRSFFNSVSPGVKKYPEIIIVESGPFLWRVDKPLPTEEEISSKLTPIYVALHNASYVALHNEGKEKKIDSPDSQLKERELDTEEKDKEEILSALREMLEEKVWEEKRKDKVEGLLEFINYLLQTGEGKKDEFSDSTEYKDYVNGLSKIKEKLENEKDSLIEKEFYLLFSSVHQIYDRRITNLLNRK